MIERLLQPRPAKRENLVGLTLKIRYIWENMVLSTAQGYIDNLRASRAFDREFDQMYKEEQKAGVKRW